MLDYKSDIERRRRNALNDMESRIAKERERLEEAYNKDLQEWCNKAALEARSQYQSIHQHQHNEAMSGIAGQIRAEIDDDYNRSMNEMYAARRSDALTMLDLNVTSCLQELSEDYKKMFEEEDALYKAKAAEMREYVKELHQLDAKRIAADEEHNRITNEVNDARAQASAKIELIKKEYEAAAEAQESRHRETVMKAENNAKLAKEQMETRTALFNEEKERMQLQLKDAQERADNAHDIVKADYEHRLTQAQDDRDSWKQTLEAYKEQHAHNNRLAAILVIAITIAAVAGGFVAGGVYWNRIVAGELSASSGTSEIKVITSETEAELSEPELSKESENTDESAEIDESTDETSVSGEEEQSETDVSESVTTSVPEERSTEETTGSL